MSAAKPLRAVGADEKPPVKPKSVIEAAEKGTHRELLVAMRTRIARTVSDPDCPPRDLAALTRRLQDIAKEIERLDLEEPDGGEGEATPDEEFDASAV